MLKNWKAVTNAFDTSSSKRTLYPRLATHACFWAKKQTTAFKQGQNNKAEKWLCHWRKGRRCFKMGEIGTHDDIEYFGANTLAPDYSDPFSVHLKSFGFTSHTTDPWALTLPANCLATSTCFATTGDIAVSLEELPTLTNQQPSSYFVWGLSRKTHIWTTIWF